MGSKKNAFVSFINDYGAPKLAQDLGVDASTVRQWRRGFCLPYAKQMYRIKQISAGRVTYADIIDDFVEDKRN